MPAALGRRDRPLAASGASESREAAEAETCKSGEEEAEGRRQDPARIAYCGSAGKAPASPRPALAEDPLLPAPGKEQIRPALGLLAPGPRDAEAVATLGKDMQLGRYTRRFQRRIHAL